MDISSKFYRLAEELLDLEHQMIEGSRSASSVFVVDTMKEELVALWNQLKEEYGLVMDNANTPEKDKIKTKYRDCFNAYVSTVSNLSQAALQMSDLSAVHSQNEDIFSRRGSALPVIPHETTNPFIDPSPVVNNSTPNNPTNGSVEPTPMFQNPVINNSVPNYPTHVVVEPSVVFRTQLPACDTEIFHGDYQSWPWFRELFTAIYVNNNQISSAQKLYYLNQRCQGEAKDIVRRCILSNAGFEAAWSSLKERFENERLLINSQLKILFSLQNVLSESAGGIKNLQREINSVRTSLEMYSLDIKTWDAIFVYWCSTKLPEITLSLWEQSLEDNTKIPQWEVLNLFLTKRVQTLETVGELRQSSGRMINNRSNNPFARPSRLSSFHANVDDSSCPMCKAKDHILQNCRKFLNATVMSRFNIVKRLGLCLKCFSKTHNVAECVSPFDCSKCHQRHHSLLHRNYGESVNTRAIEASADQQPSTSAEARQRELGNISAHFTRNSRSVLLGTARVEVSHNGLSCVVRALIDSGSEASFVSQRLQRLLKSPTSPVSAQVSGLNNMSSENVNCISTFSISSLINAFKTDIECLILPKLTGELPSHSFPEGQSLELPNLQLADPNWMVREPVDLLIGGDLYPHILLEGLRKNIMGSLLAQQTVFGWILTGPLTGIRDKPARLVSFFNEIALDKQLTRFWELEEVPKKRMYTSEEDFCERLYKETTVRNREGRYIVRLPFRPEADKSCLIGSREVARTIFLRNENNLLKKPQFKEEYDRVIREYGDLGQMVPVDSSGENCYFMPHHAVIKPDSTTTKVRVVFNASSRPRNGKSLNELLYPGPILQADVVKLLLKWRFYKFVFNGDIEKMYRQILVESEDTPFQRIFFRESLQEELKEYELKTVTFGVTCAPFLAIRTLHQLAVDVRDRFPLASTILKEMMYVDDALVGYHDIVTAKRARDELKLALESAGFVIRKWTSNSSKLLEDLDVADLLSENFLKFEDTSSAKTLGVRWNAQTDVFYFSASPFEVQSTYTKRQILGTIAKLFDPAGWLSPIIIKAKILMQSIWLKKIDWDDNVPADTLTEWKDFLTNYGAINEIRIPRWVQFSPTVHIQYHAFSDASEKAYGTCVYIRVETEEKVICNLLCAKSKVAPVKSISLPRLELCGASLLADMVESLDNLNIDLGKLYCWTDSTIVLAWLKKPPCMWKVFVANRVAKITEKLGPAVWNHVESSSNPADLVSRGISALNLKDNLLWWQGPSWLREPQAAWPISMQNIPLDTDLERKIMVHFTICQPEEDIVNRFSSLKKAVRVVSYMLRFIEACRKKPRSGARHIAGTEFGNTLQRLILLTQKAHYNSEYEGLVTRAGVSAKSSILSLNPILDDNKILRVGGRLNFASSLSFDEKHPIILPYNCALSRLIVKNSHQETQHGGNQLMLRMIRSKYWIVKVKNMIRSVGRGCKICVIHNKELRSQIMSALPKERLTLSRPFDCTGVDFCGPFDVKSYVGRGCRITKGYVCLFVCFATKAIHLEGTSDLSTTTFLEAFSRFVSRRGCPSQVFSDNGTNFVGASRELRKEFKAFLKSSQELVESGYSSKNVRWSFIPPGAPHMGGLWEAGVKSFKTHFRKVVGETKLTFEEFSTLLYRIEACLNSRPLSAQSNDPNDLIPLTPGHFLIGSPLLSSAEPDLTTTKLSLVNRWQKMKVISQEVCKRWKAEYLTELQKRVKWKKPAVNVKVDDLVVIKEENLPPNEWRLGRVIAVHPGKDELVRVVTLKTERSTLTRPINKLVVLPTHE